MVARWGMVCSLREEAVRQEEKASSCAGGDLDWLLGKIPSPKRCSSLGTDCPGKRLSHHPWKHLKGVLMCHLGTWFIGGIGSVRFAAGLKILKVSCPTSVTQRYDLRSVSVESGAGLPRPHGSLETWIFHVTATEEQVIINAKERTVEVL